MKTFHTGKGLGETTKHVVILASQTRGRRTNGRMDITRNAMWSNIYFFKYVSLT